MIWPKKFPNGYQQWSVLAPGKGAGILDIGSGTCAAARAIVHRIGHGKILAMDRFTKAIEQATKQSQTEINMRTLQLMHSAVGDFEFTGREERFDFAIAVRKGALDGRHPDVEQAVLFTIGPALKPGGKLFADRGSPMKEIDLKSACP